MDIPRIDIKALKYEKEKIVWWKTELLTLERGTVDGAMYYKNTNQDILPFATLLNSLELR